MTNFNRKIFVSDVEKQHHLVSAFQIVEFVIHVHIPYLYIFNKIQTLKIINNYK